MDAALPSGATSHDFFRRARARLTLDVPTALDDPTVEATRGDLDLDPAMWEQAGVKATRPAAVLVPVVDRSEPTVLLTLRTELPSHPGQIAFPGGKIEAQDRSPADAALREAAEEIGSPARSSTRSATSTFISPSPATVFCRRSRASTPTTSSCCASAKSPTPSRSRSPS